MAAALAASIIDFVLGLALAPTDQEEGNRISLEGLTFAPAGDGALEVRVRKLEAASLGVAAGPRLLAVGRVALDEVVARVRIEEGRPRLLALEAASAELSGVNIHAPLVVPPQEAGAAPWPAASAWSLGPLAAAEGSLRAQIVDAHLLFDADVTVAVRNGRVDFNEAKVAHVGPDSRMGVSRMGIYVDAPNGRSYLYQFSAAPVAGVEYERRGAMFGPWAVSDRGSLRLQEFAESVLREPARGRSPGLTEQARLLFDRSSASGELQLGDGAITAPGLRVELAGRGAGRNLVRVHSEALGRGLTVELAALAARNASFGTGELHAGCDDLAGSVTLRFFVEGAQVRFAFHLARMRMERLRLAHASTA